MAGTFDVALLSGTPAGGRVIPVAATATPGTLIHTAVAGSAGFDEVELYASNVTGAAVTLTVQWGGVTDPGDHLVKSLTLPANSAPVLVAPGLRLNGGLIVRAFASVANSVNISGNLNIIR